MFAIRAGIDIRFCIGFFVLSQSAKACVKMTWHDDKEKNLMFAVLHATLSALYDRQCLLKSLCVYLTLHALCSF